MGFISSIFQTKRGAGFDAAGPSDSEIFASDRNTQLAYELQREFLDKLSAQNALQNQSNVFNQQQQLADMYMAQARGEGPNIAQDMLNEATRANAMQQAAMMASQRGTQANPALLARQAAMVGANAQQQSAGQGATMRSQQQLAAMQGLGGQQANMGSLASQQAKQLQDVYQALNQNALQRQSTIKGAQSNQQSTQAKIAEENAKNQYDLMKSVGQATIPSIMGKPAGTPGADPSKLAGSGAGAAAGAPLPMSQGGMVPDSNWLKEYTKLTMGMGGMVPGRAEVSGDSIENDKVPAVLSPKEIVLPRSVTMDKNAPEKASKFVQAVLAKRGK